MSEMPDQWETAEPELAEEAATRVVGGMLKVMKTFVPSSEDEDGKLTRREATLLNGELLVGFDRRALHVARIRLLPDSFCKKKSALRGQMASAAAGLCADLSYASQTKWLKAHSKNVRTASMGPDGIRLTVAEGLVGLAIPASRAGAERGREIIKRIEERAPDSGILAGPFEVPFVPDSDVAVLQIGQDSARVSGDFGEGCLAQLRFRPKSFPPPKGATCWAYSHPLGGRIVRIRFESPSYVADTYYRVLEI